jgi:hypothetical protein
MDLEEARTEVRERIGELEEDFYTDAEINRAINEAQLRFSMEERWPWLFTEGEDAVGAGDTELLLPVDVSPNRTFNVTVDGESLSVPRPLERVTPEAGFALRHAHDLHEGAPRWYYLTAGLVDGVGTQYTMKLIPTPDLAYDIEYQYVRVPEPLAADSDLIDVPAEFVDAIPAWAAGKLFLKEFSVSQKANEQFSIYADLLNKARIEMKEADVDQIIAWGREHPGEDRVVSERAYILGRIPPTLG